MLRDHTGHHPGINRNHEMGGTHNRSNRRRRHALFRQFAWRFTAGRVASRPTTQGWDFGGREQRRRKLISAW